MNDSDTARQGYWNYYHRYGYESHFFLMLMLGFFIDGFIINQISVHYPIYTLDLGFNEGQTALVLKIMGVASGLGASGKDDVFGFCSPRFRGVKYVVGCKHAGFLVFVRTWQ